MDDSLKEPGGGPPPMVIPGEPTSAPPPADGAVLGSDMLGAAPDAQRSVLLFGKSVPPKRLAAA